MDIPITFGEWLKRRRKELDLTQAELSERASCTVFTLRKIEAGQRRPSKQLAGLLAKQLEISEEDQTTFIRVARGELCIERLFPPAQMPSRDSLPGDKIGAALGNLPRMLTPFIGREPELAALNQLLRDPGCLLLTLIGPGGIGKTRLAIEVAIHQRDIFPDGVWFVPLAPLSSSEYLIPAIADALKFRFQDPATPQEQLLNYLHDKRALLVLDNVEHLLDGAGLFTEILKRSPQVRLLVTSRERVNLLSEWVFEIHGLPVPPNDQAEPFEEYSSTSLFLQSARRIQAGFEVREDERQWVVRICQIMEGLPLGIELAAAWVGLLSCEEIAREIERNLDFLEAPTRDLPERHRSLLATLDHSWALLDSEEKVVLNRLSVFRGSFRREAAEEICGAKLNTLSSLKSKSLLRRTDRGGYDLHELIRQYAELRLAEDACEDERVKDRHAFYYAQRLSEWEKALKSSRQLETLTEIELEIDNLRQAWQRMVTCFGFDCQHNTLFNPNLFRSSLFSLSLFFELRCRYWEAVSLFGQAVDTLKAARQTACSDAGSQQIDWVLGLIIGHLGYQQYLMHYLQADESLQEALLLLENDPTKVGKARVQVMLAWVFQAQGKYENARDLFEKSRTIFQQAGDEWWVTLTLSMLAMDLLALGRIQESCALFQISLNRMEEGDLYLGVHTRVGLGYVHYFLGHFPDAERLLKQALQLSYQLGNKRQTAYSLRLLGQMALASGQLYQAVEYFQEAVNLLDVYGESPDLAAGLIYLGKNLAACQEMEAARKEFKRAVRIGQAFNIFHLVYWGLVNLARIILLEGQPEKALEMILILQQYSVESKVVQDDSNSLLAELQGKLSAQQVEGTMERIKGMAIDSLLDQT